MKTENEPSQAVAAAKAIFRRHNGYAGYTDTDVEIIQAVADAAVAESTRELTAERDKARAELNNLKSK